MVKTQRDERRASGHFAAAVLRLGQHTYEINAAYCEATSMDVQLTKSSRRWLNVEQLMTILPLRKSRVYYLTHTRQIPFVRVGKTLLFEYDAIVSWVESHGESVGISR